MNAIVTPAAYHNQVLGGVVPPLAVWLQVVQFKDPWVFGGPPGHVPPADPTGVRVAFVDGSLDIEGDIPVMRVEQSVK
jgi:hypothetical protein